MSPAVFTGILYALVIGGMIYKRRGRSYRKEKQLTFAFLLVWMVYTFVRLFVHISILKYPFSNIFLDSLRDCGICIMFSSVLEYHPVSTDLLYKLHVCSLSTVCLSLLYLTTHTYIPTHITVNTNFTVNAPIYMAVNKTMRKAVKKFWAAKLSRPVFLERHAV